jgi:hypothetical protein
MMTTKEMPCFEEAKFSLQGFLRRCEESSRVIWLFREDVTSYRRLVWVRRWDKERAEALAKEVYDTGRARGLGVRFQGLVRLEAGTGCIVWCPKDDVAASQAMMPRGLKLSVSTPLLTGIEVRSRATWAYLTWRNARREFGNAAVSEVPGRVGIGD